jgi:hypothetical protein
LPASLQGSTHQSSQIAATASSAKYSTAYSAIHDHTSCMLLKSMSISSCFNPASDARSKHQDKINHSAVVQPAMPQS